MAVKVIASPTGSGKTSWPAATPFIDSTNGKVPSPRSLGLPHDEWRKHQYETLLWLTGGQAGRVISLVKTKSLQASNYDQMYGFDAHYGRANYECVHPSVSIGTTCDQCMFLESGGMQACPVSGQCPYLLSKNRARESRRASLNYAYWMTSKHWRASYPPDVLYCDEAHNLSEVVLDFVGITVSERQRRRWKLPEFPTVNSDRGGSILINTESPVDAAMLWLHKASIKMNERCAQLQQGSKDLQDADSLAMRIGNALGALKANPEDWFILSGRGVRMYRGKPEPGFICKPLTARHHAPQYFTGSAFDTVMMSATIGNPETFAEELGLVEYDFKAVPSQWLPESRPVYALDVPRLGYKSSLDDYEMQADAIAKAIHSVDPRWCGFIHVTRKREAKLLAGRLAERGLANRVWVTPGWERGDYVATDEQLVAWEQRKAKVSNSICLSWSMWEGIDGLDERINIVAKCPFASLGDAYEKARMKYSGKGYLQRAAMLLEQGLGRTRRGREQDYDTDSRVNGLVCIADGNWRRVEKYLDQDLRESIVEP